MAIVKATDIQRQVAEALGVDISVDTEMVAAARILDDVAEAIGERHGRRPATEKQIAFGHQLGMDVTLDSLRVASARLEQELQRRNFDAIERLDLKPGDRVLKREVVEVDGKRHEWVEEYIISSIRPNSRVFFKGGNGRGAWPLQLEKATG